MTEKNALPVACDHRNVTGTFDEAGRHLSNRCEDCGYRVTWYDENRPPSRQQEAPEWTI